MAEFDTIETSQNMCLLFPNRSSSICAKLPFFETIDFLVLNRLKISKIIQNSDFKLLGTLLMRFGRLGLDHHSNCFVFQVPEMVQGTLLEHRGLAKITVFAYRRALLSNDMISKRLDCGCRESVRGRS